MADTRYNGWTNYETWVVNLWLREADMDRDFEEWAKEEVQSELDDDEDAETARANAKSKLADRIEALVDEWQELGEVKVSGMFSDLLTHALGMVDWREIAEHHVDSVELYAAGWNMPGYMPDETPALFTDLETARSYIEEELERAADDYGNADAEGERDENAKIYEDALAALGAERGEFSVQVGAHVWWVTKV